LAGKYHKNVSKISLGGQREIAARYLKKKKKEKSRNVKM